MIQAYFIFFFQAEDGIRDLTVTGVQTCALPIYRRELVHRRRAKPGLTELQYRRHQFCVPADDAPDPCATCAVPLGHAVHEYCPIFNSGQIEHARVPGVVVIDELAVRLVTDEVES